MKKVTAGSGPFSRAKKSAAAASKEPFVPPKASGGSSFATNPLQ